MKSNVKLSLFSTILTICVILLLFVGLYTTIGTSKFIPALIIVLLLIAVSLWFAPMSVSLTDSKIRIHSPIHTHSVPLEKVRNVELFQPTMGALRLFGSGGFMGYWGFFREGDTGSYTAFYGRASDCFLLTLDDGKKYVLGCRNPESIVAAIASRIQPRPRE